VKFLKLFFGLSAFLIIFSYAFILAVDPYEKYGFNLFHLKSKAVATGRENKFRQINSPLNQYEAFIVGSSSAHRFETKYFKKLTGLKTFSYALQHTTPEDNLAVIRHILDKQKNVKLIFLQVDFYALNTHFATDNRLFNSSLIKYLDAQKQEEAKQISIFNHSYFTLQALRDSIRTVLANIFNTTRKTYLKDGDHIYEKPIPGPIKVLQFSYQNYEFDKKRMKYYQLIQKECDKKNVRLIVAISALSYEHLQRIYQNKELKKKFFEFKKIIHSTFREVYDFANFLVAKEYNSYEYFYNSTHPTPKLSRILLDKVFKGANSAKRRD